MIDFQNASFLKLKPVDDKAFAEMISPMFLEGETILGTFQSVRDGVVFTNKRIFAINVQGLTGKKKDFTSLPYSKSRPSRWRPRAYWTWTASWNSGLPGWAR